MSDPNCSSTSTPVAPASAPRLTASSIPSKISRFASEIVSVCSGVRRALDPEHLLLKRPAMVEREDVQLPVISQRHVTLRCSVPVVVTQSTAPALVRLRRRGAPFHRPGLHDRDRRGADDSRRGDPRARQRDRVDARGLAVRGDQARADGVRARDLDRPVPEHRPGRRAAPRASQAGDREGRPQRPRDRRGGNAPVRDVGGPADRPAAPLPRSDRGAAIRGPPGADLRRPRACRHRRSGQGDPRRQWHAGARPGAARPVGQLAVLAGRRDRIGLDQDADLPGVSTRRHPTHVQGLGRLLERGSSS